jgi:hypothetical protein
MGATLRKLPEHRRDSWICLQHGGSHFLVIFPLRLTQPGLGRAHFRILSRSRMCGFELLAFAR